MSKFDVVYETARTDLLILAKMGLLIKEKRGKEYFFSPSKDLPEKLTDKPKG